MDSPEIAMLSRHADAAYWIGRYIERSEATARMIDVHYHFRLERSDVALAMRWSSILSISGLKEEFHELYDTEDEANILEFFAFDERNPSSIRSCIKSARENARSIRDQLSSEMWECVNRTYLDYNKWSLQRVLQETPFEFFQFVKDRTLLFQGITNRTLMMGSTRDFLDCGRFLERADQTGRILDVKYFDLLPGTTGDSKVSESEPISVGGPIDIHGWTSVLKSVGAYEAFCKTYRQGVTPKRVAEFLILNRQFPASVRHGAIRIQGCLNRVADRRDSEKLKSSQFATEHLILLLHSKSADDIIREGLHEFLEQIEERFDVIGEAIFADFLSY